MTSKELIRSFSRIYQVNTKDAEIWVNSIFEYLMEVIVDEDFVHLPLIGTFKKDYIFPRTRYNVNSGEYVQSEGRMNIIFEPSTRLSNKVKVLPPNPELASAAKKRRREKERVLPNRKLEDVEPQAEAETEPGGESEESNNEE